ncbi:hypothetical protein V6N13_049910 [Hibiscus sabdariffa]
MTSNIQDVTHKKRGFRRGFPRESSQTATRLGDLTAGFGSHEGKERTGGCCAHHGRPKAAAKLERSKVVREMVFGRDGFVRDLGRLDKILGRYTLSGCALNDILIAHPCPATLSRFSVKIRENDQTCLPLVNCRSSGLRISTAAGFEHHSMALMFSTLSKVGMP